MLASTWGVLLDSEGVYGGNIRMMLDFERIVGFDWDGGNARKSVDKHDAGQAEAEQVFFNVPLLVVDDAGHSVREKRFHALGCSDARRLLHVTFTLRVAGTLIRVISARDMSRRERGIYGQDR